MKSSVQDRSQKNSYFWLLVLHGPGLWMAFGLLLIFFLFLIWVVDVWAFYVNKNNYLKKSKSNSNSLGCSSFHITLGCGLTIHLTAPLSCPETAMLEGGKHYNSLSTYSASALRKMLLYYLTPQGSMIFVTELPWQ